jgi:succinate dehydrogenase / fumarate reductase cytochrome b subunit
MMSRLQVFLRSSIGKKLLMALTGLFLIGFLVAHLAGNLTLFADSDGGAMAAYAQKLADLGPLLWIAEIGLFALFIVHLGLGMRAAMENRDARPARYKDATPKGGRSPASVTMIATGVVILIFLVVHLIDFRLADGVLAHPQPATLAKVVVDRLSSPLGAAIYFLAMLALGLHLWHAFQSALQTLGLRHPAYDRSIRNFGAALAVVVAGLFAAFPVLCLIYKGDWPWS